MDADGAYIQKVSYEDRDYLGRQVHESGQFCNRYRPSGVGQDRSLL